MADLTRQSGTKTVGTQQRQRAQTSDERTADARNDSVLAIRSSQHFEVVRVAIETFSTPDVIIDIVHVHVSVTA